MDVILSPLGLYGGNRKMKLPLSTNTRIHAPDGHFGNHCLRTIGRMPGDRTWHSLDANHAIPTRVLRFEISGLRHRTLVRPVRPTGRTGPVLLPLVLPWLCGSTKEPSGFLVNHWKPRDSV
jgi:hypothetical protein